MGIYSCLYPTWRTFFNVFISLLYMFRATQCSSSGESILSIHHLVYIILVDDCLVCRSSAYQTVICLSYIYQMMYWYDWFSCCWALGCSKHVEKWNKYIEKRASISLLTRITPRWTVNKILKNGNLYCRKVNTFATCWVYASNFATLSLCGSYPWTLHMVNVSYATWMTLSPGIQRRAA